MEESNSQSSPARRWKPIKALDRRVLGVLAEKAKTTPDQYPLSLNSLVTGCNQKSNRYPLMEVDADAVQESIDRLKQLGAVVEVQGSSRVARFRHTLYEWLGVEKVELSVMAELLLRGAQTEGELRQRASRMDPISDLAALKALLTSLRGKGLIQSLTPEGRGHVVTHALYEDRELEKVRAEFSARPMDAAGHGDTDEDEPATIRRTTATPSDERTAASGEVSGHDLAKMREELASLRDQVSQLRYEFDQLKAALQ